MDADRVLTSHEPYVSRLIILATGRSLIRAGGKVADVEESASPAHEIESVSDCCTPDRT